MFIEKENNTTAAKDREDKLRLIREKQNEERQRKLEELKAQALAAQKFREQKEEERKRRIEDLKLKENDRRSQVEERKKAIYEAERERREYILKRNQVCAISFYLFFNLWAHCDYNQHNCCCAKVNDKKRKLNNFEKM